MAKTVTLKTPISQGSKEIDRLEFPDRKLRGRDLKGIDLAKITLADNLMLLIGRLTGEPPNVVEDLEFEDLMACMEAVLDFLPGAPSPTTGKPHLQ